MGKVIDFPLKDMVLVYIKIKDTDDFLVFEKNLREFVKGLPISNDDHDKLIKLMLEQIKQTEKDSFLQGLEMGLEFAKYQQE